MAKGTKMVSNSSYLMTLSLVAALLLSVYVVSGGYNFNTSSKAAKPREVEKKRLLLPTEKPMVKPTPDVWLDDPVR